MSRPTFLFTVLAVLALSCTARAATPTGAASGSVPGSAAAPVPAPGSSRAASVPATTAPAVVQRQVIGNTELRLLPHASNGRNYLLYVALPPSFKEHPERRYPVVYVCDAYWDFNMVNAFFGNLFYDKVVPEYVLVGLGYPDESGGDGRDPKTTRTPDYERLRRWDLTPTVDEHAHNPDEWGHAADFLAVVEKDVIPFIETTYRGDSAYRVLGGSSLGGVFTLYAMFARPGLFNAYIASTPAVALGKDWLFKFEEAFAKRGAPLGVRLFMTGGGAEIPSFLADIKRFNARLMKRARDYPRLIYQFRIVEGERHAGTKPESYNRGLRFAFAPLAPGLPKP